MSESEILQLTHRLLEAITTSDWSTYAELCSDDMTSFEPEADGHLVEGLGFHKHYFDMAGQSPYAGVTTTISSPHVRMMGDVAVISYIRLSQRVDHDGQHHTKSMQESRVWEKRSGEWKHVHFHRS